LPKNQHVRHRVLNMLQLYYMRKEKIALGEYYHIFNRGNNKQDILFDQQDWTRFLITMLYFQSPTSISNIGRQVSYFIKHQTFNITVPKDRIMELISFVIMPNHFHFILHEIKENGISNYMQKVQSGYAKYFNKKYNRSGHLFQGSYKLVHIKNDEQLLYLSAYIHRNPRELKKWKDEEDKFPWSSYQDFFQKNRWGNLIKPQIITEQFSSPEKYKEFVKSSSAKSLSKNHLN